MKAIKVISAPRLRGLATTRETVALICEGMKIGLLYEQAAIIAGLSIRQAKKLKKDAMDYAAGSELTAAFDDDYKTLLTVFIEGVSLAVAQGEQELLKKMRAAAAEDWKAADRLLQIMNPARYAPTKRIQKTISTFDMTEQTQKINFDELSDEELEKFIEGEYQVVDEPSITNDEVKQTDEPTDSDNSM